MTIKTDKEIQQMRAAGLVLWEAHQKAKSMVKPGVTTLEIDGAVEQTITSKGGSALFKGVPGKIPFPGSACISVNEELVHGIPSSRKLKAGDIVSIDIGVKLNGWCADAAVTWPVGQISEEKQELLNATEDVLRYAIRSMAKKTRWSHIAKKMQQKIESKQMAVVKDLVGHGIGRALWEAPQIPNYFDRRVADFRIIKGAVLAVEPMVNLGTEETVVRDDHWTIATKDNLPCAHFEHTIAITQNGPYVLTSGPNGEGWAMP